MPRILIVDDEEHIVLLASAALKRAGFETLEATTAARAVELWDTSIDLLLTDCVMPDLFGDQLASRLWEQKPELKVIFMSGNPIGSLELGVRLEENVNFVQKPFDFQTLVGAVQAAVSGNAVNGNKR
jgi:two-component system, cell cycle sensor histidine kinase and response regulator CckA